MTDKELIETFLQVMRAVQTYEKLGYVLVSQDMTANAAILARELYQRGYNPTDLDALEKRII